MPCESAKFGKQVDQKWCDIFVFHEAFQGFVFTLHFHGRVSILKNLSETSGYVVHRLKIKILRVDIHMFYPEALRMFDWLSVKLTY